MSEITHQQIIDAEDDKVLALAEHIKMKRRNRHLLATFKAKTVVTIRWDISIEDAKKLGAGYTGFDVKMVDVLHLAISHFGGVV